MSAASRNIYSHVIAVTSDYLGPAASRFIDRQITYHLKKDPQDLTVHDLPTLINWARLALSLLTDDERVVAEFTERLEALTYKKKPTTNGASAH